MRILQVHTRYREPGGEDVVVDTEAEQLRDAGHTVRQATASNPTAPVRTLAALGAASWNPVAVRRLRRLAAEFEPDVAHVHNTWFAMSPAVIATLRAARVPVVMTLHNYRLLCANAMLFRDGRPCEDCVAASPWQGVRHACYRGSRALSAVAVATPSLHRRLGTWDGVDTYIALTEFQRALMVRGGIAADRIVVKPNAAADPGPRPNSPSRSSTVLYVGRLSEEKGVDLLVEAWVEAAPRDLELVVVGDGPLRAVLEATISRVPSIRLEGPRPHDAVVRAMLTARALVFPSRWYEGLPLTVLEALAAGLPVMATDLGAMREIIRLGPEWLVDANDGRVGWQHALSALGNGLDLDETSHRARAQYEQRYQPRAATHRLVQILEDVAKGGADG